MLPLTIRSDSFRLVFPCRLRVTCPFARVTYKTSFDCPTHRSESGRVPRVLVVGAAIATLGRRLPSVVGVTELALGQLVESILLGAQHLELVLALRGIQASGIGFGGIGGDLLAGIRSVVPAKQAPQEPHRCSPELRHHEL